MERLLKSASSLFRKSGPRLNRQVLIFDLDGTLIDSQRDLATGINLMRRHYGLSPLKLDTVTGYVGDGVRNLVARALKDAPFAVDIEEAVALNKQFYRRHLHDETVLYPGVREGLAALARAGHGLAVLTNKPEQACRELLAHFRLRRRFGAVVGGDSGLPLKPDPRAVHAILERLGGAPGSAWMIGDNHTDIAAARRAGVHSIFASYGFGALGMERPELTAAGFDEIADCFL